MTPEAKEKNRAKKRLHPEDNVGLSLVVPMS